jgi:hypothetical protein
VPSLGRFWINCKLDVFATSHGKSASDGVGRSVKRIVTRYNPASIGANNNTKLYEMDQTSILVFSGG